MRFFKVTIETEGGLRYSGRLKAYNAVDAAKVFEYTSHKQRQADESKGARGAHSIISVNVEPLN